MKKKEKINWKVVVTAIVCLALIECVALMKGVNGTLMSVMIAVIAGLAGWSIPTPKILQK